MDFSDHKDVLRYRTEAQEVDFDRREVMRECNDFVTRKNGQWEDNVWEDFGTYKRPRYTFDRCKPIAMKIWGEIADQQVSIKTKPFGGGADKKVAKVYDGLVKSIEVQSRSDTIYDLATKKAIISGFAAFMVEQDWADADSMDQDLFIRGIPDAVDRVWFFGNWQSPVAEDAPAVTLDHLLRKDEFKERFGKYIKDRDAECLPSDWDTSGYYHRRTGELVSQLFYKKPITKTLYEGPDGEVYEEKDAEEAGIDIKGKNVRSRKRDTFKVMSRYYDAGGWLNEAEETVFDLLPIIPLLPHFDIVNNKVITMGVVEPLMDEQRVHNYSVSKWTNDTALAPKPKIWATAEQVKGYESKIKTININNDPVNIYNIDKDAVTPPFQMSPPGTDPSLLSLITMTGQAIEETAGVFGPSLGRDQPNQSGIAIEKIQHKGDIGSMEFFLVRKRAIEQCGKICIRAIPKYINKAQTRRVIDEAGDVETVELFKTTVDKDGNEIVLNDLTRGTYDVYSDVGAPFKSRREEAANKIEALGLVDPTIIQDNKDILLSSIDAPGMDLAAERARYQMIRAGLIPESQLSDDEKEEIMRAQHEAQANPPPPDPNTLIAEANLKIAESQGMKVEAEAHTAVIKAQQAQQKLDFDQEIQKIDKMAASQMQMVDMLNKMADTLNKLREAQGAEVVINPEAQQAYQEQAQEITNTIE